MTRLLPTALVGAPPAPHAPGLLLSTPRPNPARDAAAFELSLSDDSPARVELLDVAGRVLRSQVVSGAGSHAVTFGDLNPFAPGLYFARATSRAGGRAVRVVVTK